MISNNNYFTRIKNRYFLNIPIDNVPHMEPSSITLRMQAPYSFDFYNAITEPHINKKYIQVVRRLLILVFSTFTTRRNMGHLQKTSNEIYFLLEEKNLSPSWSPTPNSFFTTRQFPKISGKIFWTLVDENLKFTDFSELITFLMLQPCSQGLFWSIADQCAITIDQFDVPTPFQLAYYCIGYCCRLHAEVYLDNIILIFAVSDVLFCLLLSIPDLAFI